MANAIGVDTVTIASLFVECILYGFFIILFFVALYVLLRKRKKHQRLNKPMISVLLVMFTLATIHVSIDLRRAIEGFITHADTLTDGTVNYLSQINNAGFVLKASSYCIQTLVGDGFVLYRLYIVWNNDKRVVLPISICFIASIGVGIGCLQGFARASPGQPIFLAELQQWVTSFMSLTLFTNFSCTSLIAGRIMWVHRRAPSVVVGHSLLPAAVVIIESGAIYSATLIILLGLYLSPTYHYAHYITLDAVTHIIGVVFSLIIVRAGLGLTSDQTEAMTKTLPTLIAAPKRGVRGNHRLSDDFGMQTLEVAVSQNTEVDTGHTHLDTFEGFKDAQSSAGSVYPARKEDAGYAV